MDNTRRLWKTTEYCRRARECEKGSLITSGWLKVLVYSLKGSEVWEIGWTDECEYRKDYRIQISQKMQKKKSLEEPVPLHLSLL